MPGIPLLPNQVPSGRITLPSYSATDLASQLLNLLSDVEFFAGELKRAYSANDHEVTAELNQMDWTRARYLGNRLDEVVEVGNKLLAEFNDAAAKEPQFTEVGEP